ncbi:class I SAM-dependent methyltransferase, partial [Pelagibacteraceae bacterium]|nr:class I SAM-dependent methyltransferase [Pelagibacteraceae bacterium]
RVLKSLSADPTLWQELVICNERLVKKKLKKSRGCYMQFGAGLPSVSGFYQGVKKFDNQLNYNMYIFDTFTGPPVENKSENNRYSQNINNDNDYNKMWDYGGHEKFKKDLIDLKVDQDYFNLVVGPISETTKDFKIPNNEPVGIVNIDLGSRSYDSVLCTLEFLKPYLENFTLIFFDDLHSHSGNPHIGALGALNTFNNKYKDELGIVPCPTFSRRLVPPDKILVDEIYWAWVR